MKRINEILRNKVWLVVCGLLFNGLLFSSLCDNSREYALQEESVKPLHYLQNGFLSDPFLQDPTPTTVKIVWFTDFLGKNHYVSYGEALQAKTYAISRKLTKIRENINHNTCCRPVTVWRHEATVYRMTPGKKVKYQVNSIKKNGDLIFSDTYLCASAPPPGTVLKILLTSDHQNKPMVAANLKKVEEVVGAVDAVFFAGDMANIPDDYSLWFSSKEGGAFFPCMQGFASQKNSGITYHGGKILQSAPLFTAIGNHEVMGIMTYDQSLNDQYQNPRPKYIAAQLYKECQPNEDQEKWIKNNSYNHDTYDEIFSLPQSRSGTNKYYATSFGDIRLIVLHAARIWRRPTMQSNWGKEPTSGKYEEASEYVNHKNRWGGGDFIFEPIDRTSAQYRWLVDELNSEEFQQAKYKIVMVHNPLHSLGENAIPPFTDPVQKISVDSAGKISSVTYSYPKKDDYLTRDIEPLLEKHGIDLVFNAHTHVWNRFQSPLGMNHLETSNVGNSYGAYVSQKRTTGPYVPNENCILTGDPNGLQPITPSLAPIKDRDGKPLPFISSNTVTVFSILDTSKGCIDSYYFDTENPDGGVIKFDSFPILRATSEKQTDSR